jgi:hypothetical protein
VNLEALYLGLGNLRQTAISLLDHRRMDHLVLV